MLSLLPVAIRHVLALMGRDDEEGQALTEYGLILALIAIVVIAVLIAIGQALFDIFGQVRDALTGDASSSSG